MTSTNNKSIISVIVLTCNNLKTASSCLKSLEKQHVSHKKLRVILVDNGSDKKIIDALFSKFKNVIYIQNNINYGFAKGVNFGLKLAHLLESDWLLVLNDDIIFAADFINNLVNEAEKNKLLISGPKIITRDHKIWSLGGKINKTHFSGELIDYGKNDHTGDSKPLSVDFISGTALLLHKSAITQVGYFDERYFLYYDDVDYATRAIKAGIKSWVIPKISITHLETATIKKNSPSHIYHAAKSHLIYLFKFAPYAIKLRELARVIYKMIFTHDLKRQYESLALWDFILMKYRK